MSGLFQNLAYLITTSRPVIIEMLRLRGYDVSHLQSLPDEIHQMIANDMCDFEVVKQLTSGGGDGEGGAGEGGAGEGGAGEGEGDEAKEDVEDGKGVEGETGNSILGGGGVKPKKAIIHYVNQKNSNATIMNYVNQQMTMLEELDEDLTSDAVEIIFILKDKPTDTLIKTSHDLSRSHRTFIQVFWIQQLLFNILEHVLVPKHIIITSSDIEKLKSKYRLETKYQLPLISRDDPVAKFIGMRPGEVCRIERNSETAGVYHTYRCCK